jgi:hypothetical protein
MMREQFLLLAQLAMLVAPVAAGYAVKGWRRLRRRA